MLPLFEFQQNYLHRLSLIWIIISLLLLCLPFSHLNAELNPNPAELNPGPIVITEIAAYESSNHEWIEIYNRSQAPVDLTDWKFYENETQHNLNIFQGSFTLEPNSYAIIADHAENTASDYPEFTGTILDSSWTSLKESGEEIGLINTNEEFLELFTYLSCPDTSLERLDFTLNDYSELNWQVHPENNTFGQQNWSAVEIPDEEIEDEEDEEPIDETPIDEPEIPEDPDDEEPPDENPDLPDDPADKLPNDEDPDNPTDDPLDEPPTEEPDLTPPGPIHNLEFSLDDDQFIFYWENPIDPDFYQTLILKSLDSDPATPEVGLEYEPLDLIEHAEIIFLNNQNLFIDPKIEPYQTYYYLFYTLDEKLNYSLPIALNLILEPPVVNPGELQLNEIYPYPESKAPEWIELYNSTNHVLDLTDISLEDESGQTYRLSGLLESQKYLLINDFSFALNNSGDTITLKNSLDTVLEQFSYGTITFPAPERKQSYAKLNNQWELFLHATPGETNQIINSPPIAIISIQSGNLKDLAPLSLNLDGSSSYDPEDDALEFHWDYDDGYFSENENPPSHKYEETGLYEIKLTVTDPFDDQHSTTLTIEVIDEAENEPDDEETTDEDETDEKESDKADETETSDEPDTSVIPDSDQESKEAAETNSTETDSSTETPPTYLHTLMISEVLPNPAGSDSENEWIEIYNFGADPINLLNYQLDDAENGSRAFNLPEITIPPESYLVFYSSQTKISLNNSDEQARLFDPLENLIHQIQYEESAKESFAYALTENNQFAWTNYLTPGQPNQIQNTNDSSLNESSASETDNQSSISKSSKSTSKSSSSKNTQPLYQNGDLSEDLIISEFVPNPKGTDTETEWIEIQNLNDQPVNLGNWQLDDSEKGSAPYVFSDQITINPHSFLVIPRLQSKISLNNNQDQVRLFDFQNNLIDEIEYQKAPEALSYARLHIIDHTKNPKLASLTPLPNPPAEEKWEWTEEITEGQPNPTYQMLQGAITAVNTNSFTFQNDSNTAPPTEIVWNPNINSDLSEILLTPGTQIKLLVHEKEPQLFNLKNFEILGFQALTSELTENSTDPTQNPSEQSPISTKTILLILFLTTLGVYLLHRKYPALFKNLLQLKNPNPFQKSPVLINPASLAQHELTNKTAHIPSPTEFKKFAKWLCSCTK